MAVFFSSEGVGAGGLMGEKGREGRNETRFLFDFFEGGDPSLPPLWFTRPHLIELQHTWGHPTLELNHRRDPGNTFHYPDSPPVQTQGW